MDASNLRRQKTILVTDVHVMGQLGVVRSLGKAGYRIFAMSPKKDALGFKSSFCEQNVVCPAYSEAGFCNWITDYLAKNPVDAIIPSEGFLWAVQAIFEELAHLLPINPDKHFIYRYINKFDYFERFSEAGGNIEANCPQLIFVSQDRKPTKDELSNLIYPVFIKVDGAYCFEGNSDQIIKVEIPEDLSHRVDELLQFNEKFLIQGYVPGQKAAVNLWLKGGKVQTSYVMIAHHETPHTGGVASLRETWCNDAMLKDAVEKAENLGWNGALMMEYRWDRATNRFYLLEINLRFWGYLHLCLFAGVNFPLLLVDDFFGVDNDQQALPAKQVTVRNLSFEVGYLMSFLKDAGVSRLQKMKALINFGMNGLSPFIASDTFYPGDRRVWFYELIQVIKSLFRKN